MVRQGFRKWGLIALAIALLWMVFTVVVLPSAEARGGSHGGARGGIGHGFRGGVWHGFRGGLHGGDGHRLRHGFHHHRFHNHFFFGVGVGGFFPVYPFAYPYPYPYPYSVYYPAYTPVYQYQHYSPCGYYDPRGVWINALCPEYAPPVSAAQPESSSQGVSASPAEQSSEGVVEPQSPY